MVEAVGAVVQIILGYMQFAGAGVDSQIASICFTIALIAVTATRSLPSSKALKICIFFLLSGCAVLLSSAVPNTFRWLPYFSCLCPLFNLLPESIQQYFQSVWNEMRQLITVDTSAAAQSSLPAEANLDLEAGNRDGSTSIS